MKSLITAVFLIFFLNFAHAQVVLKPSDTTNLFSTSLIEPPINSIWNIGQPVMTFRWKAIPNNNNVVYTLVIRDSLFNVIYSANTFTNFLAVPRDTSWNLGKCLWTIKCSDALTGQTFVTPPWPIYLDLQLSSSNLSDEELLSHFPTINNSNSEWSLPQDVVIEEYAIFSLDGKNMMYQAKKNQSIMIPNLGSGLFFLSIKTKNRVIQKRFVIE
jgi:hypothetical protein